MAKAPSSSTTHVFVPQPPVLAPRVQDEQQQQYRYSSRQSQTITYPSLFHHRFPSAEQRRAVATLQGIPIPNCLAWLESLRSRCRAIPGPHPIYLLPDLLPDLLPELRQAGFDLINFPNELIRLWLQDACAPGDHNALQDSINNSNLRNGAVPANSFTHFPSIFSNPHIPVTSRNARGQESESTFKRNPLEVQSFAAPTSKKYDRWCFVCKDPDVRHTDPNSWKRHVRAHYAWYTCNISKCIDARFTRKENMVKHSEREHKDDYDSRLVEQSKYTCSLKHLTCGFCGFYCGSLDDLMSHVDVDHYRYSAQLCDWNDDKVIRTLLSVNEYWQAFLTTNSHLQASYFTWNGTDVYRLQGRLQEAKEPADILWGVAYHQSNIGRSHHGYVESGLTREGMDTSQPIQTFQQATGALTTQPSQILERNRDFERLNSCCGWNENVPDFPIASATTQSTSSSLSSNREASSPGHANFTSYNPGYGPQPWIGPNAQISSRPEIRDRHGIDDADLDSDDDEQPRHMQSLGHSRLPRW